GLELYEDLKNKYGTILYTKGTKITSKHIARLIELREFNPDLDFIFKLKLSVTLVQNFRNEIKGHFLALFEHQRKTKVYRQFLSQIEENINIFIDDVLSDENITIALYRTKYICQNSAKSKSKLFFEHPINVTLFSLAIASSEEYREIVRKDKTKLVDICKVGLFHNYGALNKIDIILDTPEHKRFEIYWDANRKGYSSLDKHLFNNDVFNTFHFLSKYYLGKRDIITSNNWPAVMTNIVLVADAFICQESGLFVKPQSVRNVINYLNVKVAKKELNRLPVNVLTKGLHFKDIFYFYKELSSLVKECRYDSGVPYPFDRFKSPTVFICKKEVKACKYIDPNRKAIKIIKPLGELKPGEYRLCRYLTKKLKDFYKDHYLEIKKSSQ
ncbi:hypothetical protein ACFL4V_01190, partial [Candidatus Latescibacterota bacterium]